MLEYQRMYSCLLGFGWGNLPDYQPMLLSDAGNSQSDSWPHVQTRCTPEEEYESHDIEDGRL